MNSLSGVESLESSVDYQDTVLLLQEEIARLEEELRLRDEVPAPGDGASADAPAAASAPADSGLTDRVAELTAEISRRDETIALLVEEIQRFEEAEEASRTEWEQLNQWVTEVERRVDSRDKQDSGLAQELSTERRKAESLRQALETERRTWESQRRPLEQEVERLRAQLGELAKRKQVDSDSELAVAALEGENRRLRKMCDDLTRAAAAAGEVESLRKEVRAAHAKLDEAEAKVRTLSDDLERERKEHDTAISALRSQMARGGAVRREADGEPDSASVVQDLSLVSAEERMQAFRQHLQEIHQRELEERAQKRLSARLSRLWRRTGPSQ
jgi:chromosome segregation ATPase